MPGFRLTPEEAWEFIAAAHTGIVTTLRRDGRPVTLPVWFAAIDQAVYTRTPAAALKLKRIRHDARASFLVEAGEAWTELVAVSFEARASVVHDAALAARAAALIEAKYASHEAPAERLPAAVRAHYADTEVICLEPVGRLNSWNNGALLS